MFNLTARSNFRSTLIKFISILFILQALSALPIGVVSKSHAAVATCTNSQFSVEAKHNSTFYIDAGTPITSNYVQFKITNLGASPVNSYSAKIDNFSSTKLKIATYEDATHAFLANLNQNQYVNMYWYLTATGTNSTTITFDVTILDASNNAVCKVSKSVNKIVSTITASSNKVTSITYTALPDDPKADGSATFAATVKGQTGTIGAGPTGSKDVNLGPATASDFAAKNYRLSATSYQCSGASAVTETLYIPNNTCQGNYTAIFTYQYLSTLTAGAANKISPIMQISSGTQMKHSAALTFPVASIGTASPDQVTTLSATGITTAGAATLNGTVDVGTFALTYFCFSPTTPGTTNFSMPCSETHTATLLNGAYLFSFTSGQLTPGQTYYFEFIGENSGVYTQGGVLSFTIPNPIPGVYDTTTAATLVTWTTATISGIQSGLSSAQVSSDSYFLYDDENPTPNDLDLATSSQITATITGGGKTQFSANLTNLKPGTTYYFELVVVDTGTATYLGGVLNFTTKPQINFDPNDGILASGNDVDTATVEIGVEALNSKPATPPTRNGYTFLGWAITSNATSGISTYTVNGNITFYAVWQVNTPAPAPVYVPHPPTITSLSTAEICAVGSQLTITGTYLTGATATLDGVAVRVISSSYSELVVALPMAMAGTRTLKVTNSDGSATTTIKYTFVDTPVYVNYTYPEMYKDLAFKYTFSATDAAKYAISGVLPAGLTIDPLTGEVSGTPTVTGDFTFTIVASNVCGNAYLNVYMTIDKAIPDAFTCTVAFNVPSSDTISDIKLAALRDCFTRMMNLGPTQLDPVIFLSGGVPPGLTQDELINHPRYRQICELLNSMGITAQIVVGAFNGPLDQVQIMIYWPEPTNV